MGTEGSGVADEKVVVSKCQDSSPAEPGAELQRELN